MSRESSYIEEIKNLYPRIKNKINKRLEEFKKVRKGSDEAIFAELVFCILTPQSKAKSCWKAVEILRKKNLLLNGERNEIAEELNMVRFRNKKAFYIISARSQFLNNGKLSIKSKIEKFRNPIDAREWLVKNVKGIGYKEASHFLRNIGLGSNMAILDRHILKNLKLFKIIDSIPQNLSRKKYLEIEEKMRRLSGKMGISMDCFDLLLWYKETGEIFK
ncbi:N-glycosylase/DNA lyase [Candidatus Aminicenantes bacterium AC-708-M15]|jgi:N-glycosylase/DNA lyase|nr:N-glycosylase/DNA lyase [SCandidatus Aminicenantes bacterium Aminicenantia_JdfR_composite]MCP2604132.1 N-glycosylase/DNA lyase [Candidatus Aminicenantes bacterium AC-708-M15]MCP2606271.1 N-glycosylase/DNA lyase [Candidatus Aminicenantes bacterium AC-708-I09]MCP2617961.1 N-glycosylase/DNA lyase [Candidatus Aminicenantes bacterium AC-335-A11]